MFFGAPVIIGIVSLLRTYAAISQKITRELKESCLEVVDGRLIQTPFRESCMKPINYPIAILTFIPLLFLPGRIYLESEYMYIWAFSRKVGYELHTILALFCFSWISWTTWNTNKLSGTSSNNSLLNPIKVFAQQAMVFEWHWFENVK